MSPDFFADLERQLVTATDRRPQRLRRARRRRAAALCTILLALVVSGAGLAVALSTGTAEHGAPASSTPPATTSTVGIDPRNGRTIAPGSFTVAVLNGTTVPGLGRGVANRLQLQRFKIGDVTNAATQDATSTTVFYAPGHRAEAAMVAAAIDAAPSRMAPVTRADRQLAGDVAKVIILVGSDQQGIGIR